jgi:hypothetical protein
MLRGGQMLSYRSQKEGHEGVTDPKDLDVDDQDPDEDNPDDEGDEEQDNPDEPEQPDGEIDYQALYTEAQKAISKQGAELGIWRRGDQPRGSRQQAPEPDEGDDGSDDGYLESLEQDSWGVAEARYGEVAVEAYTAAYAIFERAQTPADYIAAFEAYHEIRSQGGTPADAAAAAGAGTKRTRAEVVQPRVDPNRSDAGPDRTSTKELEEARKSGNLESFVKAATTRMGFGGESRR